MLTFGSDFNSTSLLCGPKQFAFPSLVLSFFINNMGE